MIAAITAAKLAAMCITTVAVMVFCLMAMARQ